MASQDSTIPTLTRECGNLYLLITISEFNVAVRSNINGWPIYIHWSPDTHYIYQLNSENLLGDRTSISLAYKRLLPVTQSFVFREDATQPGASIVKQIPKVVAVVILTAVSPKSNKN